MTFVYNPLHQDLPSENSLKDSALSRSTRKEGGGGKQSILSQNFILLHSLKQNLF